MAKIFKFLGLFSALFFFTYSGFAQDIDKVQVKKLYSNQTSEEFNNDKDQCLANTDEQVSHSKHKTAKNTGAGAAGGAVVGKIFGGAGIGAVVGGAAGAYRGRKMSNKDEEEFNNVYASCLREKGYDVYVEN